MPHVNVDIEDIRDECDGKCEHGIHLTATHEKAIALLARGHAAEAFALLTDLHTGAVAKILDPMEKAFIDWQKLPPKDRHAFWDDTHGKRHCS